MKPKKVIFEANYALRLSPKSGLWKEYGYEINIDQPNQSSKKIHGKSTILYKRSKENKIIAELTVGQVFINNKAPDLTLELLADKMREILNPIEFSLNANGSIETVVNLSQIKSNFQKEIPELKQYFKGKIVNDLLKLILSNFDNSKKMVYKLSENPIIEFLFPVIYQAYTATLKQESIQHFRSFNTNYAVIKTVEEYTSRSNKVIVAIKGNKSDVLNDSISRKDQDNVELDLVVKLNPIDKTIFSIEGNINDNESKYYQIGIYELNSKLIRQNEIFTQETQEKSKKNEKSWWNLLKNYQPKA